MIHIIIKKTIVEDLINQENMQYAFRYYTVKKLVLNKTKFWSCSSCKLMKYCPVDLNLKELLNLI